MAAVRLGAGPRGNARHVGVSPGRRGGAARRGDQHGDVRRLRELLPQAAGEALPSDGAVLIHAHPIPTESLLGE